MSPLEFAYAQQPMRVTFGAGRLAALADEVDRLGLRRVLVISTPGGEARARRAADLLGSRAAGVYPHAVMHVPAETAEQAATTVRDASADGCIAIGGGSAIGLGKAVARREGLPLVVVPTTYSGSEMTPVWGETSGGAKRTGHDPAVLPASVVYDPELTTSLPVTTSVTSGMNAMAHAVEALYAPNASPIPSLLAEQSVRAMAEALPALAERPDALDARARALYGAWLAGSCLAATTTGLGHKLAHVLGGSFDLPHAETHTVLLPYVLAYNAPAAPEAMTALGRALHTDAPAKALHALATGLGAPGSLAELGLTEPDLDRAADLAVESSYPNPRPVTRDGVRELLGAALQGAR
jgi:maleylacetate reductase